MIGNVNKLGTSFIGHSRYLEHGKRDAPQRERVDWSESRNLPTRDPQASARIMAATARDADSIQPPVYSFSISFDRDDPVNRDVMRQVAERTLRDLGLDEHQALIVAHRDRPHPHVHVMVNRVHPERHTVWSNWHDYRRIERSLREQEAELGLRRVPGRHAPTPERARSGPEQAPARRLERGDAAFVERVRREAGPHLTRAQSWGELERGLAEHGLSVRVDGGGLVVTDGVQKAKASDIDRATSRTHLERRLGTLGEYRARQAIAGRTLDERAARVERAPESRDLSAALDRAPRARTAPAQEQAPRVERAPESRGDLSAALDRAPRARTAPVQEHAPAVAPAPRPPATRQRPRTYAEAARDFSQEARAMYADPAAARRAFLDASARRGPARAAATLRDEPHRFGTLRPGADPGRAARAADAGFDYARQQAGRDRYPLKQSARLITEADRAHHAERAVHTATEAAQRAGREPARLAQLRDEGGRAVRSFRQQAEGVWERPTAALREVEKYRRTFGVDETARAIREAPEHFGPLRGAEARGWIKRGVSHDAAREAARSLSGDVHQAARAYLAHPTPGDVHRAVQHSREAGRALDTARAAHAKLAHVSVQGHVREAGARLASAAITRGAPELAQKLAERLVPMVPTAAASLVRDALREGLKLARDMAIGRDRGREHERERGGLSL